MSDIVIRTDEDIIRELTRYVDDLRSEREEIDAQHEDEVQNLRTYAKEREVRAEELEQRVNDIMEDNDRLYAENAAFRGQNEDLFADNDKLYEEVAALRHREASVAELTDALAIYLSWMDSPPPGIDPARHAEIARKFRMDVDFALRGVR